MVPVLILCAFLPFVIIFVMVIQKSIRIKKRLEELEEQQKEFLNINDAAEIGAENLQKKQQDLDLKIQQKKEKIPLEEEHDLDFQLIKFSRTSAWGSPAYHITVDALGNVLFHGQEAVRKVGFFEWKIYRKRIKNINSIIQKSKFFELEESSYKSSLDMISGVCIEIHLKNNQHQKITFDHAANYPIELSFLERKLDLILGTKKLWLYWSQNVAQFSIKRGLNYKVVYTTHQGVLFTILGQEFFSDEYLHEWPEINELVVQYEYLWQKETKESFKNHPRDTIWVELETGFRFLISPHRHTEVYNEFALLVETYGAELQRAKK